MTLSYRVGFRPCDVDDIDNCEEQLVAVLRAHVRPDFTVVIVGSGTGIMTAIATKLTGGDETIISYEASSAQFDLIRERCCRNGIAHWADLRFATVGSAVHTCGREPDRGPVVDTRDLPACDVLELDCEGAERVILADMTICPGVW